MAFSDFTVPLFRPLIVFLLLSQPHGGHCGATRQLQVIGPSQQILATVGDDVILPCRLEPAMNASDMRLEWARPDLSPGFIHVRANRQEYVAHKQPSFRGRTFINKLQHGDVSLKLSKVRVSDEGTYRCLVPSLGPPAFIMLVVGGERRSVFIQKTQKTSKKQPGQKTKQLQHDENFRQKLVVTEEHLYWDCDIRP
ncbi:myelin-oligodendrocyte glycoprotein-like [Anarhichas minor]|uniref:myelin-oligodendrocyte glycoprotein-like n=1 Tax=Anarhichas minor TaxID=65739 RepID=UPI003F7367CD